MQRGRGAISTSARSGARDRLHARRWEVLARYPIWDDDWSRRLTPVDARLLLAIFEARRRLERGSYGVCVGCGSAVDAARLQATPESALCAVCTEFRP